MTAERYTQVPRATLWLVQEARVRIGGDEPSAQPSFEVDVASFYLGKSLITNEQYEAFAPSHARCDVSSGDDDPVVNVSFREACAYCDWYAKLSKKAFRLPTEIEWELACRGGRQARWSWGDDPARAANFAWLAENSAGRAHAIETLKANGTGVHDTLGLAWEWTSSLALAYPAVEGDGRDDLSASGQRVLRGGSFRTSVLDVACGTRRFEEEGVSADDVGFRIARSL